MSELQYNTWLWRRHEEAFLSPGFKYTRTLDSDACEVIESSSANLRGKDVFICGSSKGIGRSITEYLPSCALFI